MFYHKPGASAVTDTLEKFTHPCVKVKSKRPLRLIFEVHVTYGKPRLGEAQQGQSPQLTVEGEDLALVSLLVSPALPTGNVPTG